MTNKNSFIKNEDYLLITIPDKIITVERAQDILGSIGEECSRLNYKKVIVDERSVERREVPAPEIMELSQNMQRLGLTKIYIAFWCQPQLINKDSNLLSSFTYNTEYLIKHFSEKEEAIAWLDSHPAAIKNDDKYNQRQN